MSSKQTARKRKRSQVYWTPPRTEHLMPIADQLPSWYLITNASRSSYLKRNLSFPAWFHHIFKLRVRHFILPSFFNVGNGRLAFQATSGTTRYYVGNRLTAIGYSERLPRLHSAKYLRQLGFGIIGCRFLRAWLFLHLHIDQDSSLNILNQNKKKGRRDFFIQMTYQQLLI